MDMAFETFELAYLSSLGASHPVGDSTAVESHV